MSGWKLIILDLAISIVGGICVYLLFQLSEQIQFIKIGVPVFIGICMFFVLTIVQSGSTPEG